MAAIVVSDIAFVISVVSQFYYLKFRLILQLSLVFDGSVIVRHPLVLLYLAHAEKNIH